MKSSSSPGEESDARVRVAAELSLPSTLRRRHTRHAQHVTPQRAALCEANGVVAIANGPVVDLYLQDNTNTPATASPSSSNGASHHDTPAQDASDSAMRLPFLMQIALDEFQNVRGYAVQKKSATTVAEQSVMAATCVVFIAPGVLLVGAAKLQDNESEAVNATVSMWLFGFRIYISAPAHQRSSEAFAKNARSRPHDQAMVQFSFLERVPLSTANGIARMEVCRHCANSQAGAVVLIMSDSNSFGVFQWRERLSDRQVCVAEIPGCSTALTAAAMSPDGRWCTLSDAIGYLYLLDFEVFEWYGSPAAELRSRGAKLFAARRLRNGSCSRSGIVMRDKPLEAVRLTSVSGGPDAQSVYSSLRWLVATSAHKIRHFLLAGSQSGSLSVMVLHETQDAAGYAHWTLKAKQIFPGVSGQRYDPIRHISARFETSSVRNGFQLVSISDTIAKYWEVKAESSSDNNNNNNNNNNVKRLTWPSIKEYFEAPTVSLSPGQAIEGLVAISQASSKLWSLLPAILCFEGHQREQDSDGWMVVVLTEKSLQLLAMETLSQPDIAASKAIQSGEDGGATEANEVVPGIYSKDDAKCDEESRSSIDLQQQVEEKREVSVVTTIQEKYRLPHTSWHADTPSFGSETEGFQPQFAQNSSSNAPPPAKQVRFDRKSKLPCAEYDQRVQEAAERVERLGSNLKMLRTSFQLFTQDVQLHMNDISEQLELATRLKHSRNNNDKARANMPSDNTTAP